MEPGWGAFTMDAVADFDVFASDHAPDDAPGGALSSGVQLRVEAPRPCVARVVILDETGREVFRRRTDDGLVRLPLAAGSYTVLVEDDRPLHDPRRLSGKRLDLTVLAEARMEVRVLLEPASTLGVTVSRAGRPARFARVDAVHADGERTEVRTDADGRALLAGLRPGRWSLEATDARRRLVATPIDVDVAPGSGRDLHLDLAHEAARVVVTLRGTGTEASAEANTADGGPVPAPEVTLVHTATGRRTTVAVADSRADVRGLLPGEHTLEVPACRGHLPLSLDLGTLAAAQLSTVVAEVPAGALITGRVVQGTSQYAAVVTLLDQRGREIDRARTDRRGRYRLGRGLTDARGLTVVATSGPESVHVTRTAIADVSAHHGHREELADLLLPVAGRRAHWAPPARDAGAMRLPSTRV